MDKQLLVPVFKLTKSPRLITILTSHYCEKARWALERLRLPYIEEAHLPLFHWLATLPCGGQSVPVLVSEAGVFIDSTDILKHLEEFTPCDFRLYPDEPGLRSQVEKLEDLFDVQLGPCMAPWIYFYLLDNPRLMAKLWSQSVPIIEQVLFPAIFPLLREVVRQAYKITPSSALSSYRKIQQNFDMVSELFSDGRRYLTGDHFTAADLTFACLAAPAVFPAEYRGSLPRLDEVSSEMVAQIKELQKTPAGAYALRLFSEERDSAIEGVFNTEI